MALGEGVGIEIATELGGWGNGQTIDRHIDVAFGASYSASWSSL
jgi:hypothetical protein